MNGAIKRKWRKEKDESSEKKGSMNRNDLGWIDSGGMSEERESKKSSKVK